MKNEKAAQPVFSVQKPKSAEGAEEPHTNGDSKRPKNLPANALPRDGFVLVVDGVLKTHFETSAEATKAGLALKEKYPVIHLEIFNATERKYSPLSPAS